MQFPFDECWLSKPTPPVLLHGQAMDQTDAGRWVRGIIHYLWFLHSTDSVLASLSTMTWWITSWQVTLKWEAEHQKDSGTDVTQMATTTANVGGKMVSVGAWKMHSRLWCGEVVDHDLDLHILTIISRSWCLKRVDAWYTSQFFAGNCQKLDRLFCCSPFWQIYNQEKYQRSVKKSTTCLKI